MKIYIEYDIKTSPWGGGNQFLKALRGEFEKNKIYTENPKEAEVVLFNSYHNLGKVLKLKLENPHLKLVHRIDGPFILIRGKNFEIDKLIFYVSQKIADFTIFQSSWNYIKCLDLGFVGDKTEIIHNAPDPKIFNTAKKTIFNKSKKIRIIATSWSANFNKGFEFYDYLDKNLDFNKYEFVFVGNSPIKFNHIQQLSPLPSNKLAEELKKSDIFITASKKDPCSNSLIEALSCGLPTVALNDGGHPELIGKGGETFRNKEEVIKKIELICNDYSAYQDKLPRYNIANVAQKYIKVFESIKDQESKKITAFSYWMILTRIFITSIQSKLSNLFHKIYE